MPGNSRCGTSPESSQTAANHGVSVGLVILPFRFQLSEPALRAPQDVILRFAGENRIPALDLLPAFARESGTDDREPLFLDYSHLSVRGHRLTARLVAPFADSILASPEHVSR